MIGAKRYKLKNNFKLGKLHWYKSPKKAISCTTRYRVLNGRLVFKPTGMKLKEKKYGKYISVVDVKRLETTHVFGRKYVSPIKRCNKMEMSTKVVGTETNIPKKVRFRLRRPSKPSKKKRMKSKSSNSRSPNPTLVTGRNFGKKLRKSMLRMSKNTHGRKHEFVIDSGASTHLVRSNKWLGTLLNRHRIMIRDAVGKTHKSESTGNIRMIVKRKDGTYHRLKNMGVGSSIPDLFHNLISVSTLCDHGFTVIFKPKRAEIRTPDRTVIPLTQRQGLYFVEGEEPDHIERVTFTRKETDEACNLARVEREERFAFLGQTTQARAITKQLIKTRMKEFESDSTGYRKPEGLRYFRNTRSAVNARNAAHMWHLVHRKMGHPSRAVTDGLVRSGKFGYIPMCDERDKFCEKCTKAAFFRPKQIKSPMMKNPNRGSKWHVDLAGPFKPDRNRHRYTMNMVDDCSGFIWGTTLKSKKHAVRALMDFLDWLKQQKSVATKTIYDINCLQSDRGGEFTSGPTSVGKKRSLFDKICKKMNISRRLTSAKSPNQNGKAERANRTLFNAMRCNLMDSGMGWNYWGDAYRTGLEAKNCVPGENGKLSKFERFYGFAPSYKRLMPFGATGFIEHVTDKKAITRAVCGRMIGYPKDTKGWLFIKENGQLEATSHARFDTRNYMERAKAVGQEEPVNQGFEKTQGTVGMQLGGTDAQIRENIKKYDNDIIVCSEPNEDKLPDKVKRSLQSSRITDESHGTEMEESTTENENGNDKEGTNTNETEVKTPKKYLVMTPMEAEGAIMNARKFEYTLKWDQSHVKIGKSGPRYNRYRAYTTFDDVDSAVLNKTMLKGDLKYDVMRGLCKLVRPNVTESIEMSNDDMGELELIELNFAGLIEQTTPVNNKIGPIERLYDLRARIRKGDKITDGDWNSKLIKAAHQGCVMGWNDKNTKKAIRNFALITINEIVCGKRHL